MTDSPPTEATAPAEAFIKRLYGLAIRAVEGGGDARARLARLRRTVGRRGVDPLAYREVGDALPADLSHDVEQTYLLVAALFSLHAARSDAPWRIGEGASFGASCGRLRGGSGSMDLRFAALLDARRADLPDRLRQAVALLASNGVGVRYDQLLADLLAWDDPGRSVQRRWAADYWTR